MSLKEMKEMINLMQENGLSEIEFEREGLKIKIKKDSSPLMQQIPVAAPMIAQPAAQAGAPQPEQPKNENHIEVSAPMVGTFYRAPSPESPAYVNVGDTIKVGQVLCIIEAMKLMNEIKSEVSGKLIDIKIDNAQPVEYGQVLFVVEKS